MNRRVVFPQSLRYFMAIAEHGSYTRAAEALHVSQPSLSQQIKRLEESLDVSLLARSGRTVKLTNSGEIYLHHARRAYGELNAATRAIEEVEDLSRGSLQLGWTPITDYLACSLLEAFSRKHPGIKLNTLEMPADNIEVSVSEDQIDVGIAFSQMPTPAPKSNDVKIIQLFNESLCFAVGKNHPRTGQKERMSAQEFGKETMVFLNSNFALRRSIDAYCLANSIMPHIAIETDSLSVIIEMVQNSSYGTILPKSIIQSQCGIHPIVLAPSPPKQSISLLTRAGGYASPAARAFTELASTWATDWALLTTLSDRISCPMAAGRNQEQQGNGQK